MRRRSLESQFRKHTVIYSNSAQLARVLGSSTSGQQLPGGAEGTVPPPNYMCYPAAGKSKCHNGGKRGHDNVRGGNGEESAAYPDLMCGMIFVAQECELAQHRRVAAQPGAAN